MITEAELSYEDMSKAEAKGYLCGKCQGRLVVAWGGAFGENGWILRCSDITHTGMTRHDKKYEQLRKESFSMDSNSLMVMGETAMMERVNMAKFPQDLTPADKKLLAAAAITYGFDPLMNEISIYQGRPYVSIDGRYRKAQETGKLDGVETRPASKQEREDWQIPEGDYFFRAEVFVKGASRAFVGWGRVRKTETTGGKGYKPIETNPQRMAEKRAEAQALRKAFHIPIPSLEEAGLDDDGHATVVTIEEPEKKQIADKPKPRAEKQAPAKAQEVIPAATATVLHPEGEELAPETPSASDIPTWEAIKVGLAALYNKKVEGWSHIDTIIEKMVKLGGTAAEKVEITYNSLSEEGKVKFAGMVDFEVSKLA